MRDTVPVETMQRAFADSGMNASAVARNRGWTRVSSPKRDTDKRWIVPDQSRVMRVLGLRQWKKRGRGHYLSKGMGYEQAVALLAAMDLDPVDYQL